MYMYVYIKCNDSGTVGRSIRHSGGLLPSHLQTPGSWCQVLVCGVRGGSEGGRVERKKPFADKPALKASAACVRRRIHVSLQISPP